MALNLPAPNPYDANNPQYWPEGSTLETALRVVAPGPVWVAVSTATTGGGGGGASTLDLARITALESTIVLKADTTAVSALSATVAAKADSTTLTTSLSGIDTRLTTQESRSFGTTEANVTLITAAEELAPAIDTLPAQVTALDATLYQPDDYVRVRFQDTFVTYVSNGSVFSEVPAVRDSVVPTSVVDLQQAVAEMREPISPWYAGTNARKYIHEINGHRIEIHAMSNTSPIGGNPLDVASRPHYMLMHGSTETPWLPEIAHLYRHPQIVYVMTNDSRRRRYMVKNAQANAAFIISLQTNPSTLPMPYAYIEKALD